jgi:hypothetical protein
VQAPEAVGFDRHPRQARVHGEQGDRLPVCREPAPRVVPLPLLEGPQLLEQPDPVGDVASIGRVDERERGDLAQAERRHLEDDRGEVGPQDLRVGEVRPRLEVLLGIEPDAHPVGEPPAAPGPLARAGLGHRLDRQPLHLGPLAVARDPRGPRVDDVADARHGQRGLRDVGRQHHPTGVVRGEDPVLLGRRQPAEQRHDLGSRQPQPHQRVCGVTDLALTREEHEDVVGSDLVVSGRLGPQLLDRLDRCRSPGRPRPAARASRPWRAPLRARAADSARLDRIGPPGHLDDRRRPTRRIGEVRGEPLRVDGRRRDDDLEVGRRGSSCLR